MNKNVISLPEITTQIDQSVSSLSMTDGDRKQSHICMFKVAASIPALFCELSGQQ